MKRPGMRAFTDEEPGQSTSPLVDGISSSSSGSAKSSSTASSAYLESYKKARESGRWDSSELRSDELGAGRLAAVVRNVSTKTLIFVFFLLLAGLILFITGLVFYLSPPPTLSEGEEQTKRGMDLLIVAAICLLPGLWAAVQLYRGEYRAVNLG